MQVAHNLGLGTSYKPIVQICNNGTALQIFAINNISTNQFAVGFISYSGYTPISASGITATIAWTY